MGVHGGGLRTLVAEKHMDRSEVRAVFEEMGGVGVAKRVNGRVFLDAALPRGCLKGCLQGGRVDVAGVAARE